MPAHYRAAADSLAVTRSDFAVLLYWTVPSVRFAQNLGTPQIAVDIEDVAGREEIIRALALGLYDVDPVTRRQFWDLIYYAADKGVTGEASSLGWQAFAKGGVTTCEVPGLTAPPSSGCWKSKNTIAL